MLKENENKVHNISVCLVFKKSFTDKVLIEKAWIGYLHNVGQMLSSM